MELSLFWGRFHPVLVHLPIGFLLAAGILEGLSLRMKGKTLEQGTIWLLLATWTSGLLAAWMGWLLADAGRHAGDSLEWHRWLGIGVVGLSALLWVIKKKWIRLSGKIMLGGLGLALMLVAITGHLGGELTHGEGYLSQFTPGWLGGEKETLDAKSQAHVLNVPDSVRLYTDLIEPILQEKCGRCHGEERQYGGLGLTDWASVSLGGKDGPLWQAGDPHGSNLIKRVSLPTTDPNFMPPSGEPLSYPETRLISWWIKQGAKNEAGIPDEVPEDLTKWLLTTYGLNLREQPYVQAAGTRLAFDQQGYDALIEQGWRVKSLAEDNNLLEVAAPDTTLTPAHWQALQQAASTVTWLDLSTVKGRIGPLAKIENWPHLTRLDLSHQEVSQPVLETLSLAPHLEVLTLRGANLQGAYTQALAQIPALQRIYLWESNLSATDVEQLRQDLPQVEVDYGFKW